MSTIAPGADSRAGNSGGEKTRGYYGEP